MIPWEPLASGSGIPHIKEVLRGTFPSVWWRILFVKFLGGLLGLGRKGPSVQIGAVVGQGWGKYRPDPEREFLFITAGASAGIVAVFGAPLSGVVFALEELHRGFSSVLLVSSMAASLTADALSRNIFGMEPILDFFIWNTPFPSPSMAYWPFSPCTWAFLGLSLTGSSLESRTFFQPTVVFSLLPAGSGVSPLWDSGVFRPLGPGWWAPPHCFPQREPLSVAGPFSPLFSQIFVHHSAPCFGYTRRDFLSPTHHWGTPQGYLGEIFTEIIPLDFVVLGMAGYFSAIAKAPITGILLILESPAPIAFSCLLAYVVADLLGGNRCTMFSSGVLRKRNPLVRKADG